MFPFPKSWKGGHSQEANSRGFRGYSRTGWRISGQNFCPPVIGKDVDNIDVARHDGIEEIGHRWSRMHIRRRTGRSQTSREVAML
ncbi:MAG: hypothetical protein QXU18_00130 [Thermoplasmatales archaeon]